ncbi:BadF/BadG/BcrA/BcrD ATPase family protein [uncultured Roseobacter sp.]|uniref:BadF/BadG/BcrA/BcrD ATPase family protein n=1 Tax=uncultured Roseobacter sp. TaxID=114847 RepID=UPI0026392757|nr:BadF/BadG/BcrA/BcrD ATPase family protein [uncultured Roseobacter sp.]
MSDSAQMLLIGVDGGGTGCRAAIGTLSGGIAARAEGGRANAASDPDLAVENIVMTVKAAAAKANLDESALENAVAHLGLAGVMTADDSRRIATALPYKSSVVTDDRPTAVTGALGGNDGFLLSVGTGTIVAGSNGGTFGYVGGWGFHVADQGSGAWLGRAGLEQVLLCHDGLADHSDLTRALFAGFNDDPNAIVSFSMSAKPGDFGALAPAIVTAAEQGDTWAQELMARGADYLLRGLLVLGFEPGNALCLTGGVGPCYARYLPPDALSGQIKSRGTALDGAYYLAKSSLAETRSSTT